MKIIPTLSSTVLLLACLGCAASSDPPEAPESTDLATRASEGQAAGEADSIHSMDFESGDVPEAVPEDSVEEEGAENSEESADESG